MVHQGYSSVHLYLENLKKKKKTQENNWNISYTHTVLYWQINIQLQILDELLGQGGILLVFKAANGMV